jgi:hypothetical protein
MQNNEYTLFNGSAVEISLNRFKVMTKSGRFKTPPFEKIIRFDNRSRFLADVTCVYENKESSIITVHYGNIFDVLNDRDIYHEYYSLFLHKNYPLIVNGRILLSTGRLDIIVTDADGRKDNYPSSGYTRFDSGVPETKIDTRCVKVIRANEIPDYVIVLSKKEHTLGDITTPHLSKFSEEELVIFRETGLMDTAYCMYEAWDDVSDEEKTKAYMFQTKHEKNGKKTYNDPTYANEALTGKFSLYVLEIDCSKFNIDKSNTVLFENIFQDNICLRRDYPVYMEDQADYWVESAVMPDLMKEEFNITTSLLLTEIDPDANGNVRLTVVNKLINDVRTDHGWYM